MCVTETAFQVQKVEPATGCYSKAVPCGWEGIEREREEEGGRKRHQTVGHQTTPPNNTRDDMHAIRCCSNVKPDGENIMCHLNQEAGAN